MIDFYNSSPFIAFVDPEGIRGLRIHHIASGHNMHITNDAYKAEDLNKTADLLKLSIKNIETLHTNHRLHSDYFTIFPNIFEFITGFQLIALENVNSTVKYSSK